MAVTRPALLAVAVLWALGVAVCAALYPELSGLAWARWPLERVYLGAHLAAVLAVAVVWLAWYRRRERPRREHLAALILGTAELLVIGSGPYVWGGAQGVWTPGRWELARWIYLVAFASIALIFRRPDHHDARERPRP